MSAVGRIARAAQRRAIARIVARLSGELPGARVAADRDGVSIVGRGVRDDARLRWVGGLVR